MTSSLHFAYASPRRWRSLLAFVVLAGSFSGAWAQVRAAQVMAVTGLVKAVDAQGRERPLEKGGEVRAGDTVVTGEGALVQMRTSDGGYVSVRSGSEMVFDRFVFDEKESGNSSFLVSLVKGGFRSITGLIGRLNPNAYQIRTSTATIGVRGTDHEPMFIPVGAAGAVFGETPGLYDKVNDGETFIQTGNGILTLKPGQIGFAPVSTSGVPPQMLQRVPGFYKSEVKTDARDPKDAAAARPVETKPVTRTEAGESKGAPDNQSGIGTHVNDAGGLLRPSTAARREALKELDANKGVPNPLESNAGMVGKIEQGVVPTTLKPAILAAPTRTPLAPATIQASPPATLSAPATTPVTTPEAAPTPLSTPKATIKPLLQQALPLLRK